MPKRKFTENEVREAVFEYDVHTIQGEDRRWARTNITIVKMEDGKFYSLQWDKGLTECQENEFWEQEAPEVKLIKEEKIVIEEKWVEVD